MAYGKETEPLSGYHPQFKSLGETEQQRLLRLAELERKYIEHLQDLRSGIFLILQQNSALNNLGGWALYAHDQETCRGSKFNIPHMRSTYIKYEVNAKSNRQATSRGPTITIINREAIVLEDGYAHILEYLRFVENGTCIRAIDAFSDTPGKHKVQADIPLHFLLNGTIQTVSRHPHVPTIAMKDATKTLHFPFGKSDDPVDKLDTIERAEEIVVQLYRKRPTYRQK